MNPPSSPRLPDSNLIARCARQLEVGSASVVIATLLLAIGAFSVGSCGSLFPFKDSNPSRSSSTTARTTPPRSAESSISSTEPVLRIRIGVGAESTTVAGPVRMLVGLAVRSSDDQLLASPITVTREDRVWRVEDGVRKMHAFVAVGEAEHNGGLRIEGVGPTPLTVSGKAYPGQLNLIPVAERGPSVVVGARTAGDGQVTSQAQATTQPTAAPSAAQSSTQFDIIELVAIESYLPGVVAKELPSGWDSTTYKAQAIIARSYALHEQDRARRVGRRHDLEASESDQVYLGISQDAVVVQAVRDTRGTILTHQGRVLRTYYSSTCGGRASAAKDVWPTTAGFEYNLDAPIQGHAHDEYCVGSPLHRWTVTRDRDELTRRVTAYGRDTGVGVRGIKSFTGATASTHNSYGRPTQFKVFDSDGTWWPLSAEQLRSACNWTGSSGLPPVTRQERVNSGDATYTLQGDKIIIAGGGFGHGVGLCQYGAQGMARASKGVEEILRFYYPGARIERSY